MSALSVVSDVCKWQFFPDMHNGAYTTEAQVNAWREAGGEARIQTQIAAWVEANDAYPSVEAIKTWVTADVDIWMEESLMPPIKSKGIIDRALIMMSGLLILPQWILFLMWVYRANYNVRCLGARDLRFTPGWSVGWFFVPIANLWKSYQVMKEIWQASINVVDWQSQRIGSLLLCWYLSPIFIVVLCSGSVLMYVRITQAWVPVLSSAMTTILTAFIYYVQWMIILKIYNAQMAQYKAFQAIDLSAQREDKALQVEV